MAVNPSIQLGTSGNWAIKEDNLLAYKQLGNKFFDREFDFSRGTRATFVGRNGLIQESGLTSAELVTNGDFATDSDWAKGAGWSISNGAASCDGTQTSNSQLRSAFFDFSVDTTVTLSFDVINYSAGALDAGVTGTGQADLTGINANGTYSVTVVSSAGSRQVDIVAKSDFIGSIDNVSVKEIQLDVPRIDFTDDPTGHLLLEPQSTNLIPYSENVLLWSTYGTIIREDNVSISPNGKQTASTITSTDVSTFNRIRQNFSVSANSTCTASLFIKKVQTETNYLGLGVIFTGATTDVAYISFDSVNGIARNMDSRVTAILNVVDYGTYWRLEATATDSESNTQVEMAVYPTLSTNGTTVSPGASSIRTIWGMQLELNSYATSYIPTSGSAVTRNQESCNNSGTVNDFNSEEGVLYAEISALGDTTGVRGITLSDGSSNNRVYIHFSSDTNIRGQIRVGASNEAVINSTQTLTNLNKIALKYKANDFALWINGVEVGTDTSGNTYSSNTLTELSFDDGGGGNDFYGKTKNLKVFKRALTDAELYLLTVTQYQSYQEMATALNYTL